MFQRSCQSRSQNFVPLDQRSENESSGSIPFQITMEITEFCISGFIAHACAVRILHVWYLWRMPEMDAPRALVFRPLVKGNEALGMRLRSCLTGQGWITSAHVRDLMACVGANGLGAILKKMAIEIPVHEPSNGLVKWPQVILTCYPARVRLIN